MKKEEIKEKNSEEENVVKENKTSQTDGEEMNLSYASKKEVAKGGLLGVFIGLAVIVPGVSGSAIAIIFKLYEKLLYAFGNILKRFRKCIMFLLPILIGAVIGFALGFFGVRELLNLIPFAIIALFAGLMLGAYPAVTDEIKGEKVTAGRVLLFVAGLAVPVAISAISIFVTSGSFSLENLKFYHYILFVLIGFLIAITQLVPGLSATALLMSFGVFTEIMNSVSLTYWKANPSVFLVYVCLAVGFLVGIVSVSKLLTKLFEKYHAPAFFMISGLSLGSIITMFFNSEVIEVYRSWGAGASLGLDLGLGIGLLIVGLILSFLLVRYEKNKSKNVSQVKWWVIMIGFLKRPLHIVGFTQASFLKIR